MTRAARFKFTTDNYDVWIRVVTERGCFSLKCECGKVEWCEHLTDLLSKNGDVAALRDLVPTENWTMMDVPIFPSIGVSVPCELRRIGDSDNIKVSMKRPAPNRWTIPIPTPPGQAEVFVGILSEGEGIGTARSMVLSTVDAMKKQPFEAECTSAGHRYSSQRLVEMKKKSADSVWNLQNEFCLALFAKCLPCYTSTPDAEDYSDLVPNPGPGRRPPRPWDLPEDEVF